MDKGHKRSLTSVYRRIQEDGHDVGELKRRINDIFIKTIITGYPTLSQSITSVHQDSFGNDMCFEVLGFDIMIDSKLNPCLLEINYTPSFTADTPLDRHIKKNLIEDAMALLNITEKWKKEMKMKRDREIQERMISGKRKKYTAEERRVNCIEEARKRDEHEAKNMGRFTKIFLLSEQQMQEHKKYYDFSMELHQSMMKL